MKILVAFCFVVAAVQAIDVDWATVDKMQIVPKGSRNFFKDIPKNQGSTGSRITGGEEAIPGQFPYQVALLATNHQGTGFCGGSILHEDWVLTAAHCVEDAISVELIIAAHNIIDGDPHQYRVPVKKIIVHEDWNRTEIVNDIALLELFWPLEYSDRVQPIRLPSRSQVNVTFTDEIGIVSGWGRDSDESTGASPVLLWTSNPIIANDACSIFHFRWIIDSKVCLAGTDGRSACNGDSGGPLVVVESNGELIQIGIVSYRIIFGCARGWPSVYCRTSSYLDWIETHTGGDVAVRS